MALSKMKQPYWEIKAMMTNDDKGEEGVKIRRKNEEAVFKKPADRSLLVYKLSGRDEWYL